MTPRHLLPVLHATYLRTLDAFVASFARIEATLARGKPVTTAERQDHEAIARDLAIARAAYWQAVDALVGQGVSGERVGVAA